MRWSLPAVWLQSNGKCRCISADGLTGRGQAGERGHVEEMKTRQETSSGAFNEPSEKQRRFVLLSDLERHLRIGWRRLGCRMGETRKRASPGCPSGPCLHGDVERVPTNQPQTSKATERRLEGLLN